MRDTLTKAIRGILVATIVIWAVAGCVPVPQAPLPQGRGLGDTNFTNLGLSGYLEFEGATADDYETVVTVVDPTADRTITLPNSSGTVALNPAAGSIEFEGATADDYETTLAVVDPTADRTVTIPNETGAVMMSSLATNGTGITNSVTGGTNALVFEGATADTAQTSLSVTDPTTDRSIVIPDAAGTVMLSTLATNAPDAANSVTGASNGLVFEGSAADTAETTLSATNPTTDRSIVLPDAAGTLMLSSLATNGAEITNSVTGGTNALIWEGATADEYETSVTVVDPTADRTFTLPNYTGTALLSSTANEPDTANAFWVNTGDLKFEGSSADGNETTVTVVNPTGARVITLPNETGAVMMSSLATNGTGITNSVTGGTNALVFEGATADTAQTSLSVTDPTTDRSIVIPDAAGTLMLSSLATNAAEITNSVTGGTNALIFEGATADNYETSVTVVDPTADNTITFPNASGYPVLSGTAPDGVDAWWFAGQDLKHEGSTANEFEAIIRMPADPAADYIYVMPSASGTVAFVSGATTLVVGGQTVTGTATATHGLTTPLYALCSIGNAAQTTAEATCSVVITGSTVTLNTWDALTGLTPGAAPAKVYWQVAGTP
jgi:hypothetical protein